MSEIIGVRFKEGGKIYYFRPNDEELKLGCHVIVETVRGTECGEVVMERREIDENEFNREVKSIIRKATDADLARFNENKIKAKKAFDICNQKIKAHNLEMNLLDVECTFDNSKIVFSFSAEGRVDFRELVKDLASVFRARIELRQIGVRDEAKMLGGLGICGRPFCCHQFMGDFQSVSIKMAKEQGLSLNPVKISGTCGRLMCCLKHEQDAYEDLMRTMPQIGSAIMTPEGSGTITDRELIAGKVKVKLDGTNDSPPKTFRVSEIYKPGEKPSASPQNNVISETIVKSSSKTEENKPNSTSKAHTKNEKKNKPQIKADNAGKPLPAYDGIDFEESLSGNLSAYEDMEDDVRISGKRNNSRRSGRRPDRRNHVRREKNQERQEEKALKGTTQKTAEQKGGIQKNPNGKNKQNFNKKNSSKNHERTTEKQNND